MSFTADELVERALDVMNTVDKIAFSSVFTSTATEFGVTEEYLDSYSGAIDYSAQRASFEEKEVTNETATETECFLANNTSYSRVECGTWEATPVPSDLFAQLFAPGGGLRLFSTLFLDEEDFEFEGTIGNTVTVVSDEFPEGLLEALTTEVTVTPNYFLVSLEINANTYFIEQAELRFGARFEQGGTVQDYTQAQVIRAIPLPASFVIPTPSGIPEPPLTLDDMEHIQACNCLACIACTACVACVTCVVCIFPVALTPVGITATSTSLTVSAGAATSAAVTVGTA